MGGSPRAYLAAQAATLRTALPRAAAGDDDAVHDARTATRRLRAALDVCRPALPPDEARRAGAALRDLGRALGAVRDPAVELAWLTDALAAMPPSAVAGPVAARLAADRGELRRAALDDLGRAVAAPGCERLLATLDALAAVPGEHVRLRRVRRRWRRLDRALDLAGRTAPGRDRDAALHAARKQARRARYAAELVGTPAALRSAARAEAVQEALGAQHDAVLAREAVDAAWRQAVDAGEDTATYDALRALAQRAAARAERRAGPAAARARRHGHLRWAR